MNKGVEILLERMKSNPDEFVPEIQYGASKWSRIINTYSEYLTEEENKAITEGYKETVKKVMQERFTAKVMEELLDPKESESSIVSGGMTQGLGTQPYNPSYYAGTGVGGGGGGIPSNGSLGGSGGLTLTTNNNGSPMWVSGQSKTQATLTLGQTPINELELQHMKLHMEHQRRMVELQAKEAQRAKKISMLERLLGK